MSTSTKPPLSVSKARAEATGQNSARKNLQVLHLLQGTKKFRNRAVFQSKINTLGVELKVAVVIQNYVKALMEGAQIQR